MPSGDRLLMINSITYKIAKTFTDFEEGKTLFKEYAASLGVDLSFQDFEQELQTIEQYYNHPTGALLLAFDGDNAIACSAIRKLDDTTAELKRMYVRKAYRGLHIGLALLQQCLQIATSLGYKQIRLDTLKDMTKAQELYSSFGFYKIPAYRFNPLEGTIYMEKKL